MDTTTRMRTVDSYESHQTSLVYVLLDDVHYISAINRHPNGSLNQELELYTKEFTDSKQAIKVYVILEQVLRACDLRNHVPMRSALKSFADEALGLIPSPPARTKHYV